MSISYESAEYLQFYKTWKKCNDAYEGQDAIKRGGEIYLPRLSGQVKNLRTVQEGENPVDGSYALQSSDEYQNYKQRAVYYNYTKKMTDGLNEQLFRKNLKVVVPEKMKEIIDSFTADGSSFLTAVKQSNRDILLNYRSVCVLDFPAIDNRKRLSVAESEKNNIRPYAAYYKASDIINWRYDYINNLPILTMVVIRELIDVYDEEGDGFEPKVVEQFRVLDLFKGIYRVRLYRDDKDGGDDESSSLEDPYEITYPKVNGENLTEIPCYFLTSKGISYSLEMPMINDIADLNLAHYVNSADYENALNITGSPTPVIVDSLFDPEDAEVTLGSSRALTLGPSGKAFFMEFQGQGLNALKESMELKVGALSVIGGRILQNDPKGAENKEVVEIQHSSERGQLSSFARSSGEAYTRILKKIAEWMKIEGEILVEFNTDYSSSMIDPQLLSNLNIARSSAAISPETYFYNLRKGEMIPEGWTFDDEQNSISIAMQEQEALIASFEDDGVYETTQTRSAIEKQPKKRPPGVDVNGKVKTDNRVKPIK